MMKVGAWVAWTVPGLAMLPKVTMPALTCLALALTRQNSPMNGRGFDVSGFRVQGLGFGHDPDIHSQAAWPLKCPRAMPTLVHQLQGPHRLLLYSVGVGASQKPPGSLARGVRPPGGPSTTSALEEGGSGAQGQAAQARMDRTTLLLMREGGGHQGVQPQQGVCEQPRVAQPGGQAAILHHDEKIMCCWYAGRGAALLGDIAVQVQAGSVYVSSPGLRSQVDRLPSCTSLTDHVLLAAHVASWAGLYDLCRGSCLQSAWVCGNFRCRPSRVYVSSPGLCSQVARLPSCNM